MTLKIGITGGIGTGKTAASKMFEELGIPIFNADKEAKWLMSNDKELKNQLINLLGEESYKDGDLNRAYIASRIFNDKALKIQMESIVHPAVRNHFINWFNNQEGPYILKEAALIYETEDHKNLDYVIVVDAPEDTRIRRVKERDQTDSNAIKSRISNQMDQAQKVKKADFILQNDKDLEYLQHEVINLDKKIRDLKH